MDVWARSPVSALQISTVGQKITSCWTPLDINDNMDTPLCLAQSRSLYHTHTHGDIYTLIYTHNIHTQTYPNTCSYSEAEVYKLMNMQSTSKMFICGR